MALGERKPSVKQDKKFLNLVYDAVDMENGREVSRQKIIQRVQKACRSQKNVERNAKMAIMKAVDSGMLVRTSGSGLNGSFRLSGDSNCQLISITKRVFVHEDSKPSNNVVQRLRNGKSKMFSNAGVTEEFELKAILKAPRSSKASGFHVKFSSRSPKIYWISPRPNKRQRPRRFNE